MAGGIVADSGQKGIQLGGRIADSRELGVAFQDMEIQGRSRDHVEISTKMAGEGLCHAPALTICVTARRGEAEANTGGSTKDLEHQRFELAHLTLRM
jgi:hypothetical protein